MVSGFANGSLVVFEPKLNLNDLNLVDEKTMCTVKNSKALYRHMNPTDIPVFFF